LSHDPSIVPSAFVVDWIGRGLVPPPGRTLDVAMGYGRHTLVLARSGLLVFGVDQRLEAVQAAARAAGAQGLALRAWCADLTASPLPSERFELVLVTRYLQRNLFESIRRAVVPGGLAIYETFTVAQRTLGFGPTSTDHLLDRGELRSHFGGFEVLHYEEVDAPEAVARIVARKPRA
jgi:tellurite methyltransferase